MKKRRNCSCVKVGCSNIFPQFCKSDMSRYGYLEVFQRVPGIRDNEIRLQYRNCPGIATITEHSLPMTPRGWANKPWQTVHKSHIKEKQSNQLHHSKKGDNNSRQDRLNRIIKQRTGQNGAYQAPQRKPGRQTTLKQRRFNIDSTSRR